MIAALKRLGLARPWQRYALVFALSFPFAFGLRAALQWLLFGNIATNAVSYLREKEKRPLSEPLAAILRDPGHQTIPTQPHPLLGRAAIDFALPDDRGQMVRLEELRREGPLVLVFYLGYNCTHCVAQLFALDEDLRLFEELGARIVAVSPDLPETTAARFRKYGRFGFPALSDPDHRVAGAYGVHQPASGDEPESLVHGTFLIDGMGRVLWANTGAEPFLDNKTLLRELARAAGVR
jgi:peroxiredoxin